MAVAGFTNMYSEEFFDCCKDPKVFACAFFCTPCLVGEIVAGSKQGDCFGTAACLVAYNLIPYIGSCISAGQQATFINKVGVPERLPSSIAQPTIEPRKPVSRSFCIH